MKPVKVKKKNYYRHGEGESELLLWISGVNGEKSDLLLGENWNVTQNKLWSVTGNIQIIVVEQSHRQPIAFLSGRAENSPITISFTLWVGLA